MSIDNEGLLVARQLADAGYTSFVLRYRTLPTPRQPDAFAAQFSAMVAETMSQPAGQRGRLPAWPAALDDARAALSLLRQQAQRWDVRPDKIHFIGFSAGAVIGQRLLETQANETLPDSMAMLYGPMAGLALTRRPPPLFVALADDDPLFGRQDFGLVDTWRRLGQRIEIHLYERGGHGFGMPAQGTTSDAWLSQYVTWLRAQ